MASWNEILNSIQMMGNLDRILNEYMMKLSQKTNRNVMFCLLENRRFRLDIYIVISTRKRNAAPIRIFKFRAVIYCLFSFG